MGGCLALVVAAGSGERLGGAVPKQYRMLAGQPVVRRALSAFIGHEGVDAVRAVIGSDQRQLYDEAAAALPLLEPVVGGATRQQSVLLGLESLVDANPDFILIHDAARPLVDRATIARTLTALDRAPGAVAAVPVNDTLKRADPEAPPGGATTISATVPRDGLWRAQTPQGFRFPDILAAHRRFAGANLTDDAAVFERAGLAVELVQGHEDNVKVTTEDDLSRAERIIATSEIRTGLGFDVHRFGPGDRLMLCGVAIPFGRGLEGHSDADVGLHALTDALLGAVGAGDIGTHFSPEDARWRDAASEVFLREAGRRVAGAGGSVTNVDLTLICERPRIAEYRDAMVASVARILGIATDRVSIKGTTTERLGFTGREEGIAAQAIATVRIAR
ncbi:MAG: bifunctional 2-C-methyl-D-erythritol 4-phosphate cytidylyltransferase/2-C-methyl-D-erythritol 2,4-cyclodiphosphate synthase [Rhodospirillales bacterium]|nr:bifunctional 2-C-methyl-D-erythritol 4-phosphate cytidylyltransferase/2-C-methyl-D-erythritol 2,4-cyclodiphosphate synthase [Rhodospirillales bacterium]